MFDFFSWKFAVGRVFGMTIRVHILFLLVLIPLVFRFSLNTNIPGTWIDVVCFFSLVVLTTLLHEMGHCFAARAVGGEADEIMLWPLGGTAQVNYLPSTPWAHFATAAGGPLVNLALCIVSALGLAFLFDESIRPVFNPFSGWYPYRWPGDEYHLTSWSGDALTTSSLVTMVFVWTFYANWFLFVFNVVLVGLPFDGGNMVRAALWPYTGFHQATLYMITTGFIIAGLMFMGAFVWDSLAASMSFLALFTFFMCRNEWLLLESRGEEGLFGYDFSAGYTSLEKDQPATPARKKQNFLQRWLQKRQARKLIREQEQQVAEELRMDELLAKIQRQGKESLTDEETRFLKRVSDRYRNRK